MGRSSATDTFSQYFFQWCLQAYIVGKTMNSKLVTVIMPTFNNQETIGEAISSVINQTYDNWELLIIDDGSTDETLDVVRNFKNNNKKIRVLNTPHMGNSFARNYGLNNAQGELFAFLDSDDYYDLDFLEKGVSEIVKQDADVAVFNYIRFSDRWEKVVSVGTGIFNSYTAVWNKIYKRELWQGIEFPIGMKIEDLEIVTTIMGKASKIIKIDESFYHYRIRDSSVTHHFNPLEQIEIIKAIEVMDDYFKKFEIKYDHKEYILFVNSQLFTHMYIGIRESSSFKERRILFKEIFYRMIGKKTYLMFSNNHLKNVKDNLIIDLFKFDCFNFGVYIAEILTKVMSK